MPEYSFYQDTLVNTVERTHFKIVADDYPSAVNRILAFKDQDADNHQLENYIKFGDFESFYEASVKLSPDQNNGVATIRIYNESDDQLIADNKQRCNENK